MKFLRVAFTTVAALLTLPQFPCHSWLARDMILMALRAGAHWTYFSRSAVVFMLATC